MNKNSMLAALEQLTSEFGRLYQFDTELICRTVRYMAPERLSAELPMHLPPVQGIEPRQPDEWKQVIKGHIDCTGSGSDGWTEYHHLYQAGQGYVRIMETLAASDAWAEQYLPQLRSILAWPEVVSLNGKGWSSVVLQIMKCDQQKIYWNVPTREIGIDVDTWNNRKQVFKGCPPDETPYTAADELRIGDPPKLVFTDLNRYLQRCEVACKWLQQKLSTAAGNAGTVSLKHAGRNGTTEHIQMQPVPGELVVRLQRLQEVFLNISSPEHLQDVGQEAGTILAQLLQRPELKLPVDDFDKELAVSALAEHSLGSDTTGIEHSRWTLWNTYAGRYSDCPRTVFHTKPATQQFTVTRKAGETVTKTQLPATGVFRETNWNEDYKQQGQRYSLFCTELLATIQGSTATTAASTVRYRPNEIPMDKPVVVKFVNGSLEKGSGIFDPAGWVLVGTSYGADNLPAGRLFQRDKTWMQLASLHRLSEESSWEPVSFIEAKQLSDNEAAVWCVSNGIELPAELKLVAQATIQASAAAAATDNATTGQETTSSTERSKQTRKKRASQVKREKTQLEIAFEFLKMEHGYSTDNPNDTPVELNKLVENLKAKFPDEEIPSKATFSRMFDKFQGYKKYERHCRQGTIQTQLAIASGEARKVFQSKNSPKEQYTYDEQPDLD